MKPEQNATKRLLILSALIDLSLGFVKVAIGIFAGSYALVIDGIHSFTDLVTDIMVWIFNAIGSTDPDEDHPYGHARFETFGTLILGSLLVLLAAFIVYDTGIRLIDMKHYVIPTWPALLAATISIIAKEWLYQVTYKLGVKTRSKLLQANAWHHRTDAISSMMVLVGVAAALIGFPWLELLAAIGVAVMIAMIGWTLIKQSVSELVDTALSEVYVKEIKESIENVEGVRGVHSIRTRQMGADALVDIHLQVDASISVSEGHQIGEWVTRSLLNNFPEINDVIFHIDAEDDEHVDSDAHTELAPLRREIRKILTEIWQDILPESKILKMNLHYLNNRIEIELFLDSTSNSININPEEKNNVLLEQLEKKSVHLPWLANINIWYK